MDFILPWGGANLSGMRIGSETVAEIVSVQDQQEPGLGFRVDGTIPKVGGGLDPLIVRKNQRVGAIYSQSTKRSSSAKPLSLSDQLLPNLRESSALALRESSSIRIDPTPVLYSRCRCRWSEQKQHRRCRRGRRLMVKDFGEKTSVNTKKRF